MPSLWFIVPVHGRLPLAAICLRQLRRTCDALTEDGIEATAVVIGDKDNLGELKARTCDLFGFGTVRRDNRFLSRKYNDGIQLALDPAYNRRPADFVVPCGSDDWVDHTILLNLPRPNQIVGFQHMSFVREDGREISASFVNYPGGCGIRIYPRQLLAPLGFRPADEDRVRACDTSILTNVRNTHQDALQIVHADVHERQIVDWKSADQQVNSYREVGRYKRSSLDDPFDALAGIFPDEALEDMRRHYSRELVAA